MFLRPMLAVLAVTLAACQAAETPDQMAERMRQESAAAKTAIDAVNVQFSRLFSSGAFDSVAALYTDDAVVMAPNAPAWSGGAAIRAGYGTMKGTGTYALHLTADDVTANGPLAVERGHWTLTYTPPDGAAIPDSGHYLVQWRKTDAGWRLVNDIWNSTQPLPGM